MYKKQELLLLVTFLFSALFFQACSGKKEKKQTQKDRVVPVEVCIASAGTIDNLFTVNGTLLANEEVELHPEVEGRVVSLGFEEGSGVSAGQVLVKLDDEDGQAQLKKLKAREQMLSSDERRKKKLLELKGISQEEYDQTFNELEGTKADILLVQAQIRKTEIKAPFRGMVGLRNISPGSYVSPLTTIARLLQLDPIRLEFSLPEQMASILNQGDQVTFRATGVPEAIQAVVYALEPGLDPATRSRKVRARCSNPSNRLKPGSFARIEIPRTGQENSFLLPTQALIPQINGYKVMLLRQGMASSQVVEPGIRSDSLIEIITGIKTGDTVILTALMQLKDKAKVKVIGVRGRKNVKGVTR